MCTCTVNIQTLEVRGMYRGHITSKMNVLGTDIMQGKGMYRGQTLQVRGIYWGQTLCKGKECTGDRHYKWEECTGDRHKKPVYSTCVHINNM